ncbi:S8 family peptidase [Qipengyuania sp. ASV99]
MRAALAAAMMALLTLAGQAQAQVPADPFMASNGTWQQDYPDSWWADRVGLGSGPQSAWRQLPANPAPVIVAVIDSGLDWNHLDVDWNALWTNPGEIADNGVDDDGNGYVDDMIGWNFLDNSNQPWDHDGHGTFVTGQISAGWNNGVGVAGVNPHARIMVLRALNTFGNTRASYLARAIVYAADNGARIINMSVGGPGLTEVEREALRYATEKGVLIVVAAGNDGQPVEGFGLASSEQVITVGAAGLDDLRAPFSNYGSAIDLLAPGVDILSLRARRTDTLRDIPGANYTPGAAYVGEDRRYYRASGTSFAAPIVTGIASLLLSARPELTPAQLRNILISTARDVGIPGVDQFSGYGMVNAAAALQAEPDSFVTAAISGVEVVQTAEGTGVAVNGSVAADRLSAAYVEIGAGEDPQQWTRVIDPVAANPGGRLGIVPAERFRGSAVWIIRLVVIGANGQQREARFRLSLG